MKLQKGTFFSTIILLIVLLYSSSCALIFAPKKQKFKITTDNSESVVYVDNVKLGKGKSVTGKVAKGSVYDVIIQTPGYLNERKVILSDKPGILYHFFFLLDIPLAYPALISGAFYDPMGFRASVNHHYEINGYLSSREEDQKFIRLSNIEFDAKSKQDLHKEIYCKYKKNTDLNQLLVETEEDQEEARKEQEEKDALREAKKKKRLGKRYKEKEYLEEKEDEFNVKDSKFSTEIAEFLRKGGYNDTVSRVFYDELNTVYLSAKIKQIKYYRLYGNRSSRNFCKVGLDGYWYAKNTFNEIIDSFPIKDFSGEQNYAYGKFHNGLDNLIQECLNKSFNSLLDEYKFKQLIKKEEIKAYQGANLKIKHPNNVVRNTAESIEASVIIKRTDKGHGSGFAISNDGYILTNFHVIASTQLDTPDKVSVLLQDSTELKAKVVRYSKAHDLALLKVEHEFPKSFELNQQNNIENMMNVFTVGAPESMDLGQTVTPGNLARIREAHGLKVLQLSMSVNKGNSGGPIFDEKGRLHGVVQSKLVGFSTEGVAFGIPGFEISKYLKITY
ncbi:MAG: trypsin-like serine protease [Bacteroidetes bacterium]|nr:MAG: trypsin-like serine protease [Bacteroidota bacterium]